MNPYRCRSMGMATLSALAMMGGFGMLPSAPALRSSPQPKPKPAPNFEPQLHGASDAKRRARRARANKRRQ